MVTRASGSGVTKIKGRDQAEVLLFLQRRWEDDKGNIYAQRVGTAVMRIGRDVPQWVNGYRLPILYGDVSQRPDYDPSMELMDQGLFYALNSKGKMVPVQETCWGGKDVKPTHLILMFSSGSLGAYTGALGNALWVDNVKMAY